MIATILSIRLEQRRFVVEYIIDDFKEVMFFMPDATAETIQGEIKKVLEEHIALDDRAKALNSKLSNTEII